MFGQQQTNRLFRKQGIDALLNADVDAAGQQPAQYAGEQALEDGEPDDVSGAEAHQPQDAEFLGLAVDIGPQAGAQGQGEAGQAHQGDDPEDQA